MNDIFYLIKGLFLFLMKLVCYDVDRFVLGFVNFWMRVLIICFCGVGMIKVLMVLGFILGLK